MSKNRDKIPVFSYYGEKEEIKMTGEELVAFAKSKMGRAIRIWYERQSHDRSSLQPFETDLWGFDLGQ